MFRRIALSSNVVRVNGAHLVPKSFASGLATKFDQAVEKLPLREAARYEFKNQKFTAQRFQKAVNAHSKALVEHQLLKAGDTIAVWLPNDMPEKHVTLLAAAKLGLKVFDISTAIVDVPDIREVLKRSNCKAIYFHPEYVHNYITLLRKSIPEFFYYDDSKGQLFHSKYFPKLTYFIHIGLLSETGALNFSELLSLDEDSKEFVQAVDAVTEVEDFYTEVVKGGKGLEFKAPVSSTKVLDLPSWSFAKKLVSHEYYEVKQQ